MKLGEYLVSREWNDCVTLNLETGRWQVTPFNPAVVLPDFYVIDSTGRAQPNPAYHEAHMLRYSVDERKVNGTKVGERLPDFLSEIYPWMDRLGIERAARQLQDRKDLLYVSNGMVPALDRLTHEMKSPATGGGESEIYELMEKISKLETSLKASQTMTSAIKTAISSLVSDIASKIPAGAGGGKYVGYLKSVKSSLEALL